MYICPYCGNQTEEKFCPHDGYPTIPEEVFYKDQNDPLIGTVIQNKYKIIERVGKGGMGSVYRAIQINIKKWVALKLMNPDFSNDPVMVKRFFREVVTASRLSHPGIVSISDFGQTEDGKMFIVMELIEGVTLKAFLKKNAPLNPALALEITRQIAGVLDAAHRSNIVHRDLKPENIFLLYVPGQGLQVKVVDFGIAKIVQGTQEQNITRTGMILGTPQYMSPEQCMGTKIDGRSDIYSLGVILYEMLTGKPPFTSDTPVTILMKHVNDPVPDLKLEGIDEKLNQQLDAFIKKLLAKKPEDRFQSGSEVIEKLTEIGLGFSPKEFEKLYKDYLQKEREYTKKHLKYNKDLISEKLKKITISKKKTKAGQIVSDSFELQAPRKKTWVFFVIIGMVIAGVLLLVLGLNKGKKDTASKQPEKNLVTTKKTQKDVVETKLNKANKKIDASAKKLAVAKKQSPDTEIRKDVVEIKPQKKEILYKDVSVKVKNTSALVYQNGVYVGKTPFKIRVKKGEEIKIVLKKPGYYPKTISINFESDDIVVSLKRKKYKKPVKKIKKQETMKVKTKRL